MGLLEGRTAVVTGSGQGIGRATAELFIQEGARVGIAELHADTREETVRELQARFGEDTALELAVDVTDPEEVRAAVNHALQAFGRIDIWINNAGASWGELGLDISDKDWRDIIALNLTGQF